MALLTRAGHLQVRAGQIIWADQTAHQWLSYDAGRLVGEQLMLSKTSGLATTSASAQELAMGLTSGSCPVERTDLWFRSADGLEVAVSVCVEWMGGGLTLWSFVPKASSDEPDFLATSDDPGTGSPYRIPSHDELRKTFRLQAHQSAGFLLAVCFITLGGFRDVEDQIGRAAGKSVLREINQRLRRAVPAETSVTCIGDDGFAVLMSCDGPMQCDALLMPLLMLLSEPVDIDDQAVQLRPSIGVALNAWGEQSTASMFENARHAAFWAKRAGGARPSYFDSDLARVRQENLEARERFTLGMQRQEFFLEYQPKVDMELGTVVGVEALVRWQHPERGRLQPAAFIELIQDDELVERLGDWVIGEAVRQAAEWSVNGVIVSVSVNISARHLLRHDFIQCLVGHLAKIPDRQPGMLELEILETTAIDDFSSVAHLIGAYQALGVRVTIDDFGTGYSSLTYLRQLPVNAVKLDQSFVRGIVRHPEDRAIVEGMLLMVHSLGRQAIAEGVESVAHGHVLLALGCTYGQGYGIAKPMLAKHIPAWISAFEAAPPWQVRASGTAK